MNNDFEKQLRAALRPVDPGPEFTQRTLARIERAHAADRSRSNAWPPARAAWVPVALAASAVFGAVVTHAWHVRHERQGLEARQQLMDALRVTGEKLDLAYRVVNAEPPRAAPDENPSNEVTRDDKGA